MFLLIFSYLTHYNRVPYVFIYFINLFQFNITLIKTYCGTFCILLIFKFIYLYSTRYHITLTKHVFYYLVFSLTH